ncbi:MAG: ribonuclease HI [Buchnera aphidicola (Chaetogeoica yunlongensis)]
MLELIKIFSDGSCLKNPGPGGYSCIIQYNTHEETYSSGFYLTTNNRMELMGIIIALESLKKCFEIIICTDSQYVNHGISYWIKNWKNKGWKTSKNTIVKNIDLWMRLEKLLIQHTVTWNWIKSHSGNIQNEKCDYLARQAAKNPIFKDIEYVISKK